MAKHLYGHETYNLVGAPNFRDLGDAFTVKGPKILRGRVFRSERLSDLTETDIKTVKTFGLQNIIDLRSAKERELFPNNLHSINNLTSLNINMITDVRSATRSVFEPLRDDHSERGAQKVMKGLYERMPESLAPHLRHILNTILKNDSVTIIHCTAGKDRTGFVSALLLHVLGVTYHDYIQDYLSTSKYLDDDKWFKSIENLLTEQLGKRPSEIVTRTILGTRPEYLDSAFKKIYNDY